ncbi:MAG: hypothetical protein ACYDD6_11160 [Acidimicrobiales bacterium]
MPDERGVGLLDVVVASAVLILIAVPAAQILLISSNVVTSSKSQAIAESIASGQIEADRQLPWTGGTPPSAIATSVASLTANGCNIGTTNYSGGSKNGLGYSLTGCQAMSGGTFFTWQQGGWCYTAAPAGGVAALTATTIAGETPVYWVDVMATWGTAAPVAPGQTPPKAKSVVLSSALQNPKGAAPTSAPCPL